MAVVEVRNLTKQFDGGRGHGHVRAIDGINLATDEGEYLVLLGPSGCGKTTLLRTIAGLEDPTDGEVLIGGNVVNGLPPRLRRIAMVFQSYALYPHKTVLDNIVFPLKAAQLDKAERESKARWAAELLGIDQLLSRRPRQLSGGGTATRRAGASNGQGTPGLPAGRAAVQPRRQTTSERSGRAQAISATRRDYDDLCDARPVGGDGPRRPDCRDGVRSGAAAGSACGGV